MSEPWEDFGSAAVAEPEEPWKDFQPVKAVEGFSDEDQGKALVINPEAGRFPTMRATAGGPRVPLASAAETIAALPGPSEAVEAATTPAVNIPRFDIKESDSAVKQIGKEAVNLLAGIPEFLSSPLGAATAVVAPAAPAVTAGLFAADTIKNLGEIIYSTYKNWNTMSTAEKRKAIVDITGTAEFGILMGHGAARPFLPKPQAPFQGPIATGEVMQMPPGARPTVPDAVREILPKTAAAAEQAAIETPTPQPEKGPENAEAIRSDEGQIPPRGTEPEIRQDQGGENLQQPASGTPVAPPPEPTSQEGSPGVLPVSPSHPIPRNKLSKSFSDLTEKLGRGQMEGLLSDWNGSELSEDGRRIITRDLREGSGQWSQTKGGFFSWLFSNEPFDPKQYTQGDEWVSLINQAREIALGKEPSPQGPEGILPVEQPGETLVNPLKFPSKAIPAKQIATRPDLMQFKRIDTEATGENQGELLSGDFDELKAGTLMLWEPKDPAEYGLKEGQKYIVANGHHRFAFGERSGVKAYNSQVLREADGYSAQDARRMAAEANIADGKGTIYDQTKFLRNAEGARDPHEEMVARKRVGARGRQASTIAFDAGDDLYTSFINERITPDQTEAIAAAAPKNESAQGIGIKFALAGKEPDFLSGVVRRAMSETGGKADQLDMFGGNDAAMKKIEEEEAKASQFRKEIRDQIQAVQGAAKRPEVAKKMGVNVSDPQGILKRVQELKAELARWQTWFLQPDLAAKVKGDVPKVEEPLFGKPESVEEQKARLEKESAAKQAAMAKEGMASKAAAPLKGTAGDLGQGDLLGGPTDLFAPPPPKGPGLFGMGGALEGEVIPLGPRGEPVPTYGPSARMLEVRRQRGVIAPVERGKGVGAEEEINRGRELLAQGADPEAIMSSVEKTKRFNSDEAAVLRAHGERLEQAAYSAADRFGPNSEQYEKAWEADSEWSRRMKIVATEWHKTGQGLQGETEIDTGTFHGLRKAHFDQTGKDFTPQQAERARSVAKGVKDATDATDKARENLYKTVGSETADPKVRSLADRIIAALDKSANDALARIKARRAKGAAFSGGIDPAELDDYIIYGASKMAKGGIQFGQWSAEMVKDIGDFIAPHLKQIWSAADKRLDEAVNKATTPAEREAVRQAVKKTPLSPEHLKKVLEGYKPGTKMTVEQAKAMWQLARGYINKGITDFDEIRNKLATDIGLPVNDVTKGLAQPKGARRLTDDLWKKQQQQRRTVEQAKRWVRAVDMPMYEKAIRSIPRALFSLKVGFHGTVALGTHAPTVAFQPLFWKTYATDFVKMYRMVGSEAYYENQVQDLMRRPNFVVAQRAGLVNDPFTFEEYHTPAIKSFVGKVMGPMASTVDKLTGMGNRGYTVLKILRQDMFDQHWNQLPESAKTPEVAQAIADGLNHATGVVKGKAPPGTNLALFAPRLEASRVAWLAVDPARAAHTFLNWNKATESAKMFALMQIKEKAWVTGTLFSLLALNQGILKATGDNQEINFDDPFRSDFLNFKAAGMRVSYGNAMVSMAKLPLRLWVGIKNEGKLNKIIYEDENVASILFDYARSQASPFAGLNMDLAFGRDFEGRPLPRKAFGILPQTPNMKKRLKARGAKPYTWPEFTSEELAPIPFSEGLKEVWGTGLGATPRQEEQLRKGLFTIAFMSATGARMGEDYYTKR